MKYQTLVALSLASVALADKNSVINGVYNDINAHIDQYLKIIDEVPADLLQLFKKAQTYTDQSYTTLYDSVDLNEVSTFATGLPWYDERLKSLFADGSSSTAAPASTTEESSQAQTSSDAPAESSSVSPSSSSAVVASSSDVATTSEPASSKTTSSNVPSSSVETVNESNAAGQMSLGYYMAPVAAALGAAALL